MIDGSKYNLLPTTETVGGYPTILDILKDVVAKAEDEQLMNVRLIGKGRISFMIGRERDVI